MSGAQGNGAGAGAAILQAIGGVLAAVVRIEGKVDLLIQHLGANRGASGAGAPAAGRVADLREIQGERGDPKIGKRPKTWEGDFPEGLRASQCHPDFLDEYAGLLDWKADHPREGKEKYADYDRRDAARCRRWAVEIREGRVKQEIAAAPPATSWDEGPPAARPTPHSAGNAAPADPWEESNDGSGW